MAIHLFIDTNVYLSFYHNSSDALPSLEKLGTYILCKRLVPAVIDGG
ncbi:hypothetical protein AB4Y42_14110 [Paraburkholderia sp. EG286B]